MVAPKDMSQDQRLARIMELQQKVLSHQDITREEVQEAMELLALERGTPRKTGAKDKPEQETLSLDSF